MRLPGVDRTRLKTNTRRVLSGGLVVSGFVSLVFYLLLADLGPPAPLQKSASGVAIQQWLVAYAKWQGVHATYSTAMGLGLVASVELAVALAVLLAPRVALAASYLFLNVYFFWTSHLLSDISPHLSALLTQLITAQDDFFWKDGGLGYWVGSSIMVLDLEALVLLSAVMSLTFLLNLGKGAGRALLYSLQAAALSLTILGAEIAWFDYPQFYMHVTQAQSLVNFLPSFNNADLLLSAVALLAASTFLLRKPRRY